jgi:MarR family transcriptional regulator, organic hydroperoxide resistance regulator
LEASPEQVQRALQDLRIELSIATSRVAARVGLRPADLDVLDVVVHYGPVSPTYLARRTGTHIATLTGVLARLERDGWVRRRRDPQDGRSFIIEADPGGAAALDAVYAAANRELTRLAGTLGPDAEAVLGYLLAAARTVRAKADELASPDNTASSASSARQPLPEQERK